MSTERRNQPRTELRVPLYLLSADKSDFTQVETENVSLDGFFCYTNVLFAPGEHISFLLLFPEIARDSHITKATCLQGVAEVTRVSFGRAQFEFGIGCRLATYRVLSHLDLLRTEDIMNTLLESGPVRSQSEGRTNLAVHKLL